MRGGGRNENFFDYCGGIVNAEFYAAGGAQKRPVRAMAINSLAGLVLLCAAAAVSGFLGSPVAVNPASVTLAISLGIPGVIMLLLALFVI